MAGHYTPPNYGGNNYGQMPQYYGVPNNGQPILFPDNYGGHIQQFPTPPAERINTTFASYDDVPGSTLPAQGAPRVRRRSGPGGEHVKHRRTRSGCYTCRNRRVKCDETHPKCERCRKGNRECVWPEPSTATKSRRGSTKAKGAQAESPESDEEADQEASAGLPPIPDDEEEDDTSPVDAKAPSSATSSPSPSTESPGGLLDSPRSSGQAAPRQPLKPGSSRATNARKWSDLPKDIQFYLDYHRKNLTRPHYCFKYDATDFLNTTFLVTAINYDPLLYAVAAFAAYNHTMKKKSSKVQNFLNYYNKSVSLLRLSLQRKSKPTAPALLTMLQLATVEEFLGDWVNLMTHQRAAYKMLTSLYTPQNVMDTDVGRKALSWYVRFDIFAGMLSGSGAVIDRDWFVANHDYYAKCLSETPDDIGMMYEERFSWNKLMAFDVAKMYAHRFSGQMGDEEFAQKTEMFGEVLDRIEKNIPLALKDPAKHISDFTGAPPRDPDDIVDPYDPNFMFGGDIWGTNLMMIDFWSLELMFKYQLTLANGTSVTPEIRAHALKGLKMFDSIEHDPKAPPGGLLAAHASLGMSCLFLPNDEKYAMWARRKLALIESIGYSYPQSLRRQMMDLWGVDVLTWWLPNEEGMPPALKVIRAIMRDGSLPAPDQYSQDVLDMKGLFKTLGLASPSPTDSPLTKDKSENPDSSTDLAIPGIDQDLDIEMLGASAADEAWIFDGSSPELGSWAFDTESVKTGQ